MNRTVAATLAAVLMLGLGACTDEAPTPKIAEPTSEAPTTSAPTDKESGSGSPRGAVKAWVRGWNELQATGDDSLIRSFTSDNCSTCDPYISSMTSLYAAGGSVESSGWTIAGALVSPDSQNSRYLDVAVDLGEGVSRQDANARPEAFAADQRVFRFGVIRGDSTWLVSDLVTLE